MFRKKPMLADKYVKIIIPVLIKYIKWFNETKELETIMASIESADESNDQSPVFNGNSDS